jgi:hypothetical protein
VAVARRHIWEIWRISARERRGCLPHLSPGRGRFGHSTAVRRGRAGFIQLGLAALFLLEQATAASVYFRAPSRLALAARERRQAGASHPTVAPLRLPAQHLLRSGQAHALSRQRSARAVAGATSPPGSVLAAAAPSEPEVFRRPIYSEHQISRDIEERNAGFCAVLFGGFRDRVLRPTKATRLKGAARRKVEQVARITSDATE